MKTYADERLRQALAQDDEGCWMTPEEIYAAIEHGDEKHREWLRVKLIPMIYSIINQEREACAKIAQEYVMSSGDHGAEIAQAIRERGK